MTDELQASSAVLPRTDQFGPVGTMPAVRSDERAGTATEAPTRGIFAGLCRGDGDIVGLVAYSIYKQNKLDWLRAFEASQGRSPNDGELASYIIGEGTPRRLATYRHLADATLAGHGPHLGDPADLQGSPSPKIAADYARRSSLMERSGLSAGQIAIYALIAAIFVIGVVLALRFTATPQHQDRAAEPRSEQR